MRRSLHAFLVGLLTLSFSVDTAKACWYLRHGRGACVVRPACPPPVAWQAPATVRVIVIQPADCGWTGDFAGAVSGFAYEEIACGPSVACCGAGGSPVATVVQPPSGVITVPTPAPVHAWAPRPEVVQPSVPSSVALPLAQPQPAEAVRETPRSLPAVAQPELPNPSPLTVAPTPALSGPPLTVTPTPAPTPAPAPVPDLQPVAPATNVQPVAPEKPAVVLPVEAKPIEVKPVAPVEEPAPVVEKKPEPPAVDPFADPVPAEKPLPTEPAPPEKPAVPPKDPVPPAEPEVEGEPAPSPTPVPEEKVPEPAPQPPAAPAEENLFDAPPAAKPAKPQAEPTPVEPADEPEPTSDAEPDAKPKPEPTVEPPADETPAAKPAADDPAEASQATPAKVPAATETDADAAGEKAGETEKAKPAAKDEPAPAEPAFDPFSSAEPLRRWIDDTGRHAVVGRFVATGADGVELLTPDGRTLVVPVERLSPVDRSYASEAAARQVAAKRSLPAPGTTAGL